MFKYCLGDVIAVFTQLYRSVDDGSHEHMLAYAWDHTAFQFGANEPMDWLAALLTKAGLEPKYHPEFISGRYNPGLPDGDVPEWVYDVDGAGTTGFVTNNSNRAY